MIAAITELTIYQINWIQGHDLGRRLKALVCHGGIFSSVGMWSTEELHFHYYEMDGAPWLPELEETNLQLRRGQGSPYEQRRWDPSAHVNQWSTPELVIHGEKDYRVPISESLAAFNVLQARHVPSRFLVFPDENHWVLKPENGLVWHETVLNWINQYVGLPPLAEQESEDAEWVAVDLPRDGNF
jgi:dipeptidyl aminopeptidase/acylaminoacyl peptidase